MNLIRTISEFLWRPARPDGPDLPPLKLPDPEEGERIDRVQRDLARRQAEQLADLRRIQADADVWRRSRGDR